MRFRAEPGRKLRTGPQPSLLKVWSFARVRNRRCTRTGDASASMAGRGEVSPIRCGRFSREQQGRHLQHSAAAIANELVAPRARLALQPVLIWWAVRPRPRPLGRLEWRRHQVGAHHRGAPFVTTKQLRLRARVRRRRWRLYGRCLSKRSFALVSKCLRSLRLHEQRDNFRIILPDLTFQIDDCLLDLWGEHHVRKLKT
jgi:hypothetical protein